MSNELALKQVKWAVTHPGETAKNMIKGVVRPDQVFGEAWKDLKEAWSGKGGYRRWAGGVGATAKVSGWVAAAAFVAWLALLLIPGVNVAVLLQTALYVGTASLALSMIEGKLRVQAAADAPTVEQAKEQINKSAAANAGVLIAGALMILTYGAKLILKTPIPGRLKTLGGAVDAARAQLEKVPVAGPKLEALRKGLAARLRDTRQGMPDMLGPEVKALQQLIPKVEAMSGDALLQQIVKGDAQLQELTGVNAETAGQLQEFAKTPLGADMPERFKATVVQALKEAPAKAAERVNAIVASIDRNVAALETVQDQAALERVLDELDAQLKPEAVTGEVSAAAQKTAADPAVGERVEAAQTEAVTAEQLREIAELLNKRDAGNPERTKVIYTLRTPHEAPAKGTLEGYVPEAALRDQAAIRKTREILTASNPDVIVGMERGGSFLAEALAKGNPQDRGEGAQDGRRQSQGAARQEEESDQVRPACDEGQVRAARRRGGEEDRDRRLLLRRHDSERAQRHAAQASLPIQSTPESPSRSAGSKRPTD